MPASRKTASTPPHITRGSVLDDLGFSPHQALEIRVKAEIYRDLLHYINDRALTAQQLVGLLQIHQPDVSNLLNGRISRFSVGKLIKFAGRLDLGAQVKLTRPVKKAQRLNADGKSASRRTTNSILPPKPLTPHV